MCLSYLAPRKARRKYGYKVMRRYDNKLYSITSIGCVNSGRIFYPYRWYTDKPKFKRIQCDCIMQDYPAGFHFFHSLTDAKDFASSFDTIQPIVKVAVENILCSGVQYAQYNCGMKPNNVSVAQKIKIIKIYRGRNEE